MFVVAAATISMRASDSSLARTSTMRLTGHGLSVTPAIPPILASASPEPAALGAAVHGQAREICFQKAEFVLYDCLLQEYRSRRCVMLAARKEACVQDISCVFGKMVPIFLKLTS